MSPTPRLRSKLAAALVLPLTFFLAACTMNVNVDVAADGTGTGTIDFIDDDGTMSSLGMTCDDLSQSAGAGVSDYEVEDLSTGDKLHCRITSDQMAGTDFDTFTDNGDGTITIGASGDSSAADQLSSLDGQDVNLTFTFTFPGDVVSASNGGQIDGNTVVYTGKDIVVNGFTITANKSATSGSGSSSSDSDTSATKPGTNAESESDSFPTWTIAVAAIAAAGIAGLVYVMRKGKRNSGAPTYPDPSQAFPAGQAYPTGQAYPAGQGFPVQPTSPDQPMAPVVPPTYQPPVNGAYGQPTAGEQANAAGQVWPTTPAPGTAEAAGSAQAPTPEVPDYSIGSIVPEEPTDGTENKA